MTRAASRFTERTARHERRISRLRFHAERYPGNAYLLSAACLFFVILSCSSEPNPVSPTGPEVRQRSPARTEVVIAAVGDLMMPSSIQAAVARNKGNFDILFEKVAADFSAADIVFANLETALDHETASSGYPRFNAPPGLAPALKKAGIAVVSVANNHALDAGADGLKRTLDNLEAAGLVFTGAGRNEAEAAKARFIRVRDFTIGFLSYTYGVNQGLSRKVSPRPGVNRIAPGSEADLERACLQVRQAAEASDLVAVSMHWGEEYATVPTVWQRRSAARLVAAGADVIFGHHPHVLQPVETIFGPDGKTGLVAYSLGNFISSQNAGISGSTRHHVNALRGDGVILFVYAVRKGARLVVDRAEYLPLWTMREVVGTGTIRRPVNIAREIENVRTRQAQNAEDQALLDLLTFRYDSIKKIYTVENRIR